MVASLLHSKVQKRFEVGRHSLQANLVLLLSMHKDQVNLEKSRNKVYEGQNEVHYLLRLARGRSSSSQLRGDPAPQRIEEIKEGGSEG